MDNSEREQEVFTLRPIMPTEPGEVLSPAYETHRAQMEQYREAVLSLLAVPEDEFCLPSEEDAFLETGVDYRLYGPDAHDQLTRGGDVDNEYLGSQAQSATSIGKMPKTSMGHPRRNRSRGR